MRKVLAFLMFIALLFIVSGCKKNSLPDYDTLYDDYIVLKDDYESLLSEYNDLREEIGYLEDEIATLNQYFDNDPETTFSEASNAYNDIFILFNSVVNPE